MSEYKFTEDWFTARKSFWLSIFKDIGVPGNILEIGSYEGRATTFIIEEATKVHDVNIYCVDTWEGGEEHLVMDVDFDTIESNFDHNIALAKKNSARDVAVYKLKGTSLTELSKLAANGYEGYFDLVYVDGSHVASDVFFDAAMAYQLCRVGGIIIFDDYIEVPEDMDKLPHFPKIAIDAFMQGHVTRVAPLTFNADGIGQLHQARIYQMYLQKVS